MAHRRPWISPAKYMYQTLDFKNVPGKPIYFILVSTYMCFRGKSVVCGVGAVFGRSTPPYIPSRILIRGPMKVYMWWTCVIPFRKQFDTCPHLIHTFPCMVTQPHPTSPYLQTCHFPCLPSFSGYLPHRNGVVMEKSDFDPPESGSHTFSVELATVYLTLQEKAESSVCP